MRSLRFKLIITFLIISIAGTLLTTLIVRSSNEGAFNELLREQEQAAFIGETLAYYENNGSWQGVEQGVALGAETAYAQAVQIDRARLRQALDNLVSNALRHTPAGGTVDLGAESLASGAVQITVTDTGSGIPEADLPHIFNRFYRGDRSRQEGQGESGLGLAIARSIIMAHNGTILVTSRQGTGTTFTIVLPGKADGADEA